MVYIDKFYRLYSPHQASERSSQNNALNLSDNGWDGLGFKITNVGEGKDPNDVSTVNQILIRKDGNFVLGKRKFEFMESEDNQWNAKNQKICNLLEATEPSDAVTLNQVISYKNDKFDAEGQKISNLLDGTEPCDAATVHQVISRKNNQFDAKGLKLGNLLEGTELHDAVTLNQVISHRNNKFDAQGQKLGNLLAGTEPNDAITLSQLKEVDLKKSYPNLVVADSKVGFRTLNGEVYKPYGFVYHNDEGNTMSAAGKHILCPGRINVEFDDY